MLVSREKILVRLVYGIPKVSISDGVVSIPDDVTKKRNTFKQDCFVRNYSGFSARFSLSKLLTYHKEKKNKSPFYLLSNYLK